MPGPAHPASDAPIRAAALVLTLCATVAGAAGAATISTTPVQPKVESSIRVLAPVAGVDSRDVELAARVEAVRQQFRRAEEAEVAAARALAAEQHARRIAMWDELAECETGGNWYDGGDYGGGLGIYVGTWKTYGGDEFASRPQWASKAEQILVAERIALDGYGGWGCAHRLGWVE